jgi:Insect pheromone-binding family, A10/OS-D
MKLVAFVFMTSYVVLISGQFSKKLESLNVDNILKNDRILTNYVKCLLDKGKTLNTLNKFCVSQLKLFQGPCTNEGRELKVTLPSTLKTACTGCSESERRNTRKVINHLIEKKPKMWADLETKYDPTGEHTKAFRKNIGA